MRAHVTYLLRLVVGACLMLVVGNTAADALDLRWKDIENYDHLNIVHWFDVEADRADAVFYGTSATRHAIVSEHVATRAGAALGREVEVWNLCLPGATPEIATAYVEDLFGADKPRIFFLEATPFFWNSRRKGQGPETYWRWFAGLEVFSAGVEFLDLDARWTLDSVDFRDYIHYSPTGAKRYSERFADEILVPLLREEEAAD
jgi:hypothetical protein